MMFAETLISSIAQVIVVLLFAGLLYLAFWRRSGGFFSFVGLTTPPVRILAIGTAVGLVYGALFVVIPPLRELAGGSNSVIAQTVDNGAGASVVAALALAAFVKTALAEEIFFRGVIAKRLIAAFGFAVGNAIQAATFSAVHVLLIMAAGVSATLVIAISLATGLLGWINGWLNERWAAGSILPGWAAHGTGNLLTYLVLGLDAMN